MEARIILTSTGKRFYSSVAGSGISPAIAMLVQMKTSQEHVMVWSCRNKSTNPLNLSFFTELDPQIEISIYETQGPNIDQSMQHEIVDVESPLTIDDEKVKGRTRVGRINIKAVLEEYILPCDTHAVFISGPNSFTSDATDAVLEFEEVQGLNLKVKVGSFQL